MAIKYVKAKSMFRISGTADLTATFNNTYQATTEGNYLIALVNVSKATGTLTTPVGFTEVAKVAGATNNYICGVYYKKITSSLENSVTVTSCGDGTEDTILTLWEMSGLDGTNPIDSIKTIDATNTTVPATITLALDNPTTNKNTLFMYGITSHQSTSIFGKKMGSHVKPGLSSLAQAYISGGNFIGDVYFNHQHSTTTGSDVYQLAQDLTGGGTEGYVATVVAFTAADQTDISTVSPYIVAAYPAYCSGSSGDQILEFTPSAVEEGDILYLVINQGDTDLSSDPRRYLPQDGSGGWTEIEYIYVGGSTDHCINHFYKVAEAGDNLTTFAFAYQGTPTGSLNTSVNIKASGICYVIKNVDTTDPIEVSTVDDATYTSTYGGTLKDVSSTSTNTLQLIHLGVMADSVSPGISTVNMIQEKFDNTNPKEGQVPIEYYYKNDEDSATNMRGIAGVGYVRNESSPTTLWFYNENYSTSLGGFSATVIFNSISFSSGGGGDSSSSLLTFTNLSDSRRRR